ncbi:Dihydrolipoyl dehydrogenase [Limihaloglobus sulfuriphilus]|uniref:Dihydrolipoyl dehydrogenase n=1 Tax=Limihaloglobus sulfuriphilus TaxID=1851148 RepID=A0A1Q2MES7_9BACT|nr:dihydrolipoyl dehydrogenase [Limihaloglobus sulfuriphilus]AQQ71159.1 Dihydrolipoyl dehydrogenase [Limihaloglobus sulfuriphilus]
MESKRVKAVIIGAGSAGLSAMRQIRKYTDEYVIIDNGKLGTKCARNGCMPSKALISVANGFHKRDILAEAGITGADKAAANIPQVLAHVRRLRDGFTNRMIEVTKELAGEKLIRAKAGIVSPDTVSAGDLTFKTDSIVIATGSRPRLPHGWEKLGSRLFTSDNIFEAENLPPRIAVIGMGTIGLELGQALSRLGIEISLFARKSFGQISDPEIKAAAFEILGRELNVNIGSDVSFDCDGDEVKVRNADTESTVDAVIAAMGVEPDIKDLGLENLGVDLDSRGMPSFDFRTMQVADLPVYIAGDANGSRPILHEAVDEGSIAGHNAVAESPEKFCRRVGLSVIFTHPQIAKAGLSFKEIKSRGISFVVGNEDFADQARARLEMEAHGQMNIYAESETARLIGAELVCPDGEHLAHVLALAINERKSVYDMLRMPFYHPTLAESLRAALLDAAGKLPDKGKKLNLGLCGSCPEKPLC